MAADRWCLGHRANLTGLQHGLLGFTSLSSQLLRDTGITPRLPQFIIGQTKGRKTPDKVARADSTRPAPHLTHTSHLGPL
ncbi:unnamed protein product [Boreogadus saida]